MPFRVGFLALSLFFIGLFCLLGVWQLHRYEFKKALLTSFEQSKQTNPQPISELTDYSAYQLITATGHYLNEKTMLIENQYKDNKLGVEVLTPFQLQDQEKLLLVDRGWIPEINPNDLPAVAAITGTHTIKGRIKLLNEYRFILGNNISDKTKRPLVMQKIVVQEIEDIVKQPFYPFIITLGDEPPVITLLPERHMAYAIQWFMLAIMVLIAYFCFVMSEWKFRK